MRHLAKVLFRRPIDLIKSRLHGQHHVGAGVAIGDGEDIKRVDDLLVGAQPGQAGFDQAFERTTIDRFLL